MYDNMFMYDLDVYTCSTYGFSGFMLVIYDIDKVLVVVLLLESVEFMGWNTWLG